MRTLLDISADPEHPLWVDPGEVIAVGGVAVDADDFRRCWVLLRGCQAAMPVPRTGSRHVMERLAGHAEWADARARAARERSAQ